MLGHRSRSPLLQYMVDASTISGRHCYNSRPPLLQNPDVAARVCRRRPLAANAAHRAGRHCYKSWPLTPAKSGRRCCKGPPLPTTCCNWPAGAATKSGRWCCKVCHRLAADCLLQTPPALAAKVCQCCKGWPDGAVSDDGGAATDDATGPNMVYAACEQRRWQSEFLRARRRATKGCVLGETTRCTLVGWCIGLGRPGQPSIIDKHTTAIRRYWIWRIDAFHSWSRRTLSVPLFRKRSWY
jgi:hypothetical protein